MVRILIGLSIAVVLITVVAVGTVVVVGRRDDQNGAVDEPSDGEIVAAAAGASDEGASVVPAAEVVVEPDIGPRGGAGDMDEEASEASVDGASEDEFDALEDGGDASARDRMRGLLASLTDEERRALMREMRHERMEEFRERQRYQLPTDNRLRMLSWRGRRDDNNLAPSEAQQAQINAIQEGIRPQVEARLQSLWGRQQEIFSEARALREAGQGEQAREAYGEMGEINRQIQEVKQEIDQTYQQQLATILSPEQLKALEEMEVRRRRGGRPNVSVRRGGDGNNTDDNNRGEQR